MGWHLMRARPLVLTAIGAFWPGNDASGPNQSFKALAQGLGDDFDFHLLARDRPFGAKTALAPHPASPDFAATHLRPARLAPHGLLRVIRRLVPDMLWLNGFFDREFTAPILLARRLGLLPDLPVLLSPRGEFNRGALSLKATRKQAYLSFARPIRLLDGVTLHATNEAEAAAIQRALPRHDPIAIASNVRPLLTARPHVPNARLRLVFLGRISPIKNLAFALRLLHDVTTPVQFDIHGPIEDEDYWRMCQEMATSLPAHIGVTHHGPYANSGLPELLSHADLLLLPTAGENFGHAIFEALSCGVPVLISDRTPWRDLAASQAGWDLPLDAPEAFAATIDSFAQMDPPGRAIWRNCAAKRARQHASTGDAVAENRNMLEALCA